MGKKVLVRSRYRNPLVRTVRDWDEDKNGKLVEKPGFRQFADYHCYMTPSEAATVVDSEENQALVNAGMQANYWYPAGAPLIVDDQRDGQLMPPLASGGVIANNEQQSMAARKALESAAATVAARKLKTAEEAVAINAKAAAGIRKVDRPAGADAETGDLSRPLAGAGVSGSAVRRIENPDIPGDSEVDAPTFA